MYQKVAPMFLIENVDKAVEWYMGIANTGRCRSHVFTKGIDTGICCSRPFWNHFNICTNFG